MAKYPYFSDFLSKLFNIPHEDFPVPQVDKVKDVLKLEEERRIDETINEIEVEVQDIVKEMSGAQKPNEFVQEVLPADMDRFQVDDVKSRGEVVQEGGSANRKPRRERTMLTSRQRDILEELYQVTRYPDRYARKEVSLKTNLSESKIVNWFKYRKVKERHHEKLKLSSEVTETVALTNSTDENYPTTSSSCFNSTNASILDLIRNCEVRLSKLNFQHPATVGVVNGVGVRYRVEENCDKTVDECEDFIEVSDIGIELSSEGRLNAGININSDKYDTEVPIDIKDKITNETDVMVVSCSKKEVKNSDVRHRKIDCRKKVSVANLFPLKRCEVRLSKIDIGSGGKFSDGKTEKDLIKKNIHEIVLSLLDFEVDSISNSYIAENKGLKKKDGQQVTLKDRSPNNLSTSQETVKFKGSVSKVNKGSKRPNVQLAGANKKVKIDNLSNNVQSDDAFAIVFNPVQVAKHFKIPKVKVTAMNEPDVDWRVRDQMVKADGQVISLGSFMEKEGIVVGAEADKFMYTDSDVTVMESEQFSTLYDNVGAAVSREVSNKVHVVQDQEEAMDIYHEDWDLWKKAESDKERKKMAASAFKNKVCSNPARNLTFHGYRRNNKTEGRKASSSSKKHGESDVGSFVINQGVLDPLPGYKRKFDHGQINDRKSAGRKISFVNLGTLMKSEFFKNYQTKMKKGKLSQMQFDQFKNYISHYKSGQEETENFLAFYCNTQAIEMDEEQVEEVMDTEHMLSMFQKFYGDPDPLFCDSCSKTHVFSQ